MVELLRGIRQVKAYAWEPHFARLVGGRLGARRGVLSLLWEPCMGAALSAPGTGVWGCGGVRKG